MLAVWFFPLLFVFLSLLLLLLLLLHFSNWFKRDHIQNRSPFQFGVAIPYRFGSHENEGKKVHTPVTSEFSDLNMINEKSLIRKVLNISHTCAFMKKGAFIPILCHGNGASKVNQSVNTINFCESILIMPIPKSLLSRSNKRQQNQMSSFSSPLSL